MAFVNCNEFTGTKLIHVCTNKVINAKFVVVEFKVIQCSHNYFQMCGC